MKRLIYLALSLTLLFACTSCVGKAAALPAEAVPTAAQPPELALITPPIDEEGEPRDGEALPQIPSGQPPELALITPPIEEPEEPDVRTIDPAKPMVALTYDDGPHETCSDLILDVLEEHHAVATFFEVGRNVARCPQVLVREQALGCEIASHSNAHRDLSKLKKSALLADLDAADQAFIDAVGFAPTMVRPPYGAVNKTVKYASERAMVTWSVDTLDWKSRDAQTIVDYVQSLGDLDGQVVLMHSLYESTAEATAVLVPWLQEQGYQLVTVSELMACYYGELPEANTLYGYSYFHQPRTDAPLPPPAAQGAEQE